MVVRPRRNRRVVPLLRTRSTLAFCLMIGEHFLTADHGDRSRTEVLELAARVLGA